MKQRIISALQPALFWLKRRSMQSRLVTAYIVIILIPSIIISNYFFNEISKTYTRDAVKQSQFMLELEKFHIQKQIEVMDSAAQITRLDQELIDYLTLSEEPGTIELLELSRGTFADFSRIQFNNPSILHWRLFGNNPLIQEIWPIVFQEKRIEKEAWFAEASALGGAEMWVFQDGDRDIMKRYTSEPNVDQPKISLLREINEGGRHVGIISIEMLLKEFSPKTFAGIGDVDYQMMIMDDSGTLFMDQRRSISSDSEAFVKEVHRQFAGLQQSGEETSRFNVDDRSYLIAASPVERIGAHLINVISMEEPINHIAQLKKQIIAANIILILVLSIITYFLNSMILKGLRRLTDAMKKVRRGELNTTAPRLEESGEVGELAHHFNKLLQTINELIAQGVRKQAITKEAELRTLYSQIDSHFLYNTLENIKMLAEIENQRTISDVLTSLGGMMRYNFKWTGEYVKLKDEIRHIENYIEIMNIRFDEPVVLSLDIPPYFMELEVLKMSLQPLVENSIKYSWPDGGSQRREIKITVRDWEDSGVVITVADNGVGMDELLVSQINASIVAVGLQERERVGFERSEEKTEGIGLRNVHERILLYYGKPYGLEVFSVQGQYAKVVMRIPKVLLTGRGMDIEKAVDRR
ncbi:sensor histidine kinase [Paenibacillus woosongensis]|uniref:HAMP domain-containing protein n=1 Tax=Paenibacillus woosongensis TaxID=307580 RepID=A0A7X3CNG4_9BACL|nr:sensor histidine kinase [Paenibacillus woosongensis]MUG46240.1 HAMP domain-containing protein [Paenibacillus woosongensis]